MNAQPANPPRHKDLQDLHHLSRAPILSYLQKQSQPSAPRLKVAGLMAARHPILASFSPTHLWKWITEYLTHRIGPRHEFQGYAPSNSDQGIYKMEGDSVEIRIALAGDWGTGTDEAARVAALITAFKPHYSIHLGDVYYVGDRAEVDENFLGIRNPNNQFEPCLWPKGSRGSFALNGNHEMYSRGYAYFDRMLPTLGPVTNGRSHGQKASFFCLENEYWRIIALDTGYNSIGLPLLEYIFQPDCALRPELLHWLRTNVQPRRDDPRGIVLLSHHQYYSRFDHWYPQPAKQLAEFFPSPVLWFWGHEHRLATYNEFGVIDGIRAIGRCIGHGGMPVDLPPAMPLHSECTVKFIDERQYPNDENLTIGFNGFARLSLQGNRMIIQYVDLYGSVIYSEGWTVDRGILTQIADSGSIDK
jgi:Calcineurin-like phosphoesterase